VEKIHAIDEKTIKKKPVNILIKRKFVGKQSFTDALIPIICDDMRKEFESNRTLDNDAETQ